ncbi:hypothetical protein BY458DRAFT_504569 [Sporodiniella umbellata]|nr:hypothetical protein BY458DRAFT_504569 [Sporodiniella umbellata]
MLKNFFKRKVKCVFIIDQLVHTCKKTKNKKGSASTSWSKLDKASRFNNIISIKLKPMYCYQQVMS